MNPCSSRREPSLLPLGVVLVALVPAVAHAQTRTVERPVVYGADDRTEVAYYEDEAVRRLAEESIVTLVPKSVIDASDPSDVRFSGGTLGESQQLCPGEAFAEQPTAGMCSGTLIGPDLVLTAGHCFGGGEASCDQVVAVFNYQWSDSGLETVTTDDLFSCRRLLVRAETESGFRADYAVFQLDRPATAYTPANVLPARPSLQVGDPFVLIGSGSGLPVKIDDGGRVRDPRAGVGDYFIGTPDTFGGNSGSGVFRPGSLDLFGVLIAGETDYVSDGGCNRVNVCSDAGCRGEDILYARQAIDALCEVATDAVLCGTTSVCGDGFCAYDEDASSCGSDCSAPVCGDGTCGYGEWGTCPDDCRVTAPPSWTCEPSYYGTLDGCDCECGAHDPDCDLGQEVYNCGHGQFCNDADVCEGEFVGLCSDCASTPAEQGQHALVLGLILAAAVVARRARGR